MSVKSMQAQLATIKVKKAKTPSSTHVEDSDETSWLEATAIFAGAVPSATKGFFSAIGTSYQYHEAKRKGQL